MVPRTASSTAGAGKSPKPTIDTAGVDAYVRGLPASAASSLDTLVQHLMRAPVHGSPLLQMRTIFSWITTNVYGMEDTTLMTQCPHNILRTAQTTCAGYSNMFSQLADACGLKAVHIEVMGCTTLYTVLHCPTLHRCARSPLDPSLGANCVLCTKFVHEDTHGGHDCCCAV